ncbi:hypothetical protein GCM10023187_51330 [Nibrella viscosa]|uniref:Protein kinase domain-containing protein n=1 Tax=Nibrella viscosa TaxID=1084524 RepID=A0ABP8KX80_9BACT
MMPSKQIIHDHYKLIDKIGEGGMGVVYRATDLSLDREVAVKMIHPHLLNDPVTLERFRREAKALGRLNHPNIATLHSFLQDGNGHYMVMEFVDGQSLDKLLLQNGPVPVPVAVQIILQALDGLAHAHQRHVLHRDLKPANLMLTKDGSVKVMDFGIARLTDATTQKISLTANFMGTWQYAAPELLGNGSASTASDLYALSLVLYELLTGRSPFNATTVTTLINQILHQSPAPLHTYRTDVPKALEAILRKMLAKNPAKRIPDARQLSEQLQIIAPYRHTITWASTDHSATRIEGSHVGQTAAATRQDSARPARQWTLPWLTAQRLSPAWLILLVATIVAGLILLVYRPGQSGNSGTLTITPPMDSLPARDTIAIVVRREEHPVIETEETLVPAPEPAKTEKKAVHQPERKNKDQANNEVGGVQRDINEPPAPQAPKAGPDPVKATYLDPVGPIPPRSDSVQVTPPVAVKVTSTLPANTSIRLNPVNGSSIAANILKKDDRVPFEVADDIEADNGRVVIRKGTRVYATVLNLNSGELDRSFIKLGKHLAVETSNGQTVGLEYDDESELIFWGNKKQVAVLRSFTVRTKARFTAQL